MKIKHLLYSVLVMLSFFSCINDLGNYNYMAAEEIIPITISGFEDTTVVVGSELVIKPVLQNMDDESKYEFLWYASRSETAGFAPTRDTLALTRNLSTMIKMAAENYNLVYIIRNPETDVYVRKTVKMKVQGTSISAGWYILKEINNETDFDYIGTDGKITPDVLRYHAVRKDFTDGPGIGGEQQLKGKPVKIVYQGSRYNHQQYRQDGTAVLPILANQRVIHVMSDQEIKTFNATNFHLFKDLNEVFYELPQTVQPQNFYFESFMYDSFIINAGKLNAISGMSVNVGKFGFGKVSESSPGYKLHDDMVAGMMGAMVFDMVSKSFFYATATGATLTTLTDNVNSGLPPSKNMPYNLVRLLERGLGTSSKGGFAIFQSISDPTQYHLAYFSGYMGMSSNPFSSFREIPMDAKMPTADVFAAPQSARCIYFGKGNVLSTYIDAVDLAQKESTTYTFPADETISYIGNIQRGILTVLTNSNSGWTLYGFNIVGSTPDIETDKFAFKYSGEGHAHSVMIR